MVNSRRREADELESIIGSAFTHIKSEQTFKYSSVKTKFDELRKSSEFNIRIPFKRFLQETRLDGKIYKKNNVRVFVKDDVVKAFNYYVEKVQNSKSELQEWKPEPDVNKSINGIVLGYAKRYATGEDGKLIGGSLKSKEVYDAIIEGINTNDDLTEEEQKIETEHINDNIGAYQIVAKDDDGNALLWGDGTSKYRNWFGSILKKNA